MLEEDKIGVSCNLCHRMVDPIHDLGIDPAVDAEILANTEQVPTTFASANFVIDPYESRRGPYSDADSAHEILVSPFHTSSDICGTCHNVSNPAFEKAPGGVSGDEYVAGPLDMGPTPAEMAPESSFPVERTWSEWEHSAFNTPAGLHRPEFAGAKPGGYVATCQDCHMRDVVGKGCDDTLFPAVPLRDNLPLHDMTGASTWVPSVLLLEYPGILDADAVNDGIGRARYMLQNALKLQVFNDGARLMVRLVNRTGHKLPTGYPEGRRMWINVKFFDSGSNLVGESGAYDAGTGILDTSDPQIKVYETKPGIGPDLAAFINDRDPTAGITAGPSFHFVLNNKIYKDNRIPPEGFSNAAFDTFGGAPIGHSYADGQYWDDTWYDMPANADYAEVRVYFQSVSKEFVQFLRDENKDPRPNKGDAVYALWDTNGKAPPELMGQGTWHRGFVITRTEWVGGQLQIHFASRVGQAYTIEYADRLDVGPLEWKPFASAGSQTATTEESVFIDDFTPATSGSAMASGKRFYRVTY